MTRVNCNISAKHQIQTKPNQAPHLDLQEALSKMGFLTVFPSIKKNENIGSFWIFGRTEVEKYNNMSGKNKHLCIETTNRAYDICLVKKDVKWMYLNVSVKELI